ncbi:MAG: glycogen debranching protein GlgX [Candidatus Nanopelagicales bacterium]
MDDASAPAPVWPGDGEPLGVTVDDDGANVAVWAEGADAVTLCVFDDDGTEHRLPLEERTFHVFHGYVPGMSAGTRYGFRVDGPWEPERGARWNPNKLLIDPYARAVEGRMSLDPAILGHQLGDDLARNDTDSAAFVPRSVAVRDDFDWGDDSPRRVPWGDTVIYEAHVRGFTRLHPGIPEELRGTYAGLAHPAALEHLTSLGVTAVELLPVHQFVDEVHLLQNGLTNYWGYNSIAFFAPHNAYSASGQRGQQVREFKQMVKALHDAGLEVILDVVYNHTAEGDETGPTLSYRGIDNDDYYRLRDHGRRYTDYTGCGNTFDVSRPHVLQLVMDSLRYWVQEMHVDGFRFDLASALARSFHDVDMLGTFMSTVQQDPVLRRVKLIAEPWDIGSGGYQVGEFPPLWTEWNDRYRDCVRDFWRGNAGVGELGWRLSGSADLYASEGRRPYASINFVTAHDGFTLRDLVTYERKHNEANLEDNRDGTDNNRSDNYGVEGETHDPEVLRVRQRQLRNLLTTLLLSTGVPMITAGDELGRTQRGNNNAYCQDNEISWLDWGLQPWQHDLLTTTRWLLRLRRDHRVFRRRFFFDGAPVEAGGAKDLAWLGPDGTELTDEEWHSPDTRTIGMYVSGRLRARDRQGRPIRDDSFLLLLHAGDGHEPFVLPGAPYGLRYRRILDTQEDVPHDAPWEDPAGATVMLGPRSTVLLRVTEDAPAEAG